jgi:hypothetical protein
VRKGNRTNSGIEGEVEKTPRDKSRTKHIQADRKRRRLMQKHDLHAERSHRPSNQRFSPQQSYSNMSTFTQYYPEDYQEKQLQNGV